jgi:hypothetical protein
MSKMIFLKKKIIGMYFGIKSYLKSNRYHTAKHPLSQFKNAEIPQLKRQSCLQPPTKVFLKG